MPLVNFEDQEADAPGEVPFRMESPAPEVPVLGPPSPPAWARPARVGLALTFAAAIALPVWLAFNSRNRLVDTPLDAQASTARPAAPAADGETDDGADGTTEDGADDPSASSEVPETVDTAPDGDPTAGGPSEAGRSSGSVTSTTRPPSTSRTTSTSRPTSTSTTRPSSTTTRPPTTAGTTPSTTKAPSTTAPTTVSTTEAPTTTAAPPTSASTTTTAPTTRPTTVPTTAPTTIPIPKGNLISGGGFENPTVPDEAFAIVPNANWTSTGGNIEIWATGHSGVPSFRGRQHMELNAHGPDTISQTIGVVPELTYRWSFVHRGRKDADTVEVIIDGRSAGRFSTAPGAWRRIEGQVAVPAGQKQVRFQLRAVDAGSSGNLIDDVRFVAVG